MASRPNVLFLLSVDAEEEWDWEGEFPQKDFSVNNSDQLPAFQAFCQTLGIRPTYFVDYAVAADPRAAKHLADSVANNHCEIGAHLHPWCNPPYFGRTGEKESHVVNLPIEQTEAKLEQLVTLLQKVFGSQPRSFRTGRWGINGEILQLLAKKGFSVDSSMYPFYQNDYFSCAKTPLLPYWPEFNEVEQPGAQRNILEIPVSVGFNHTNYDFLYKVYERIQSPVFEKLHLTGILWRLGLLQKIYLSPEVTDADEMVTLVKSLIKRQTPVIHMYMHSSSLIDNSTGLMEGRNCYDRITSRINRVLEFLKKTTNVQCCTLGEAHSLVQIRRDYLGELGLQQNRQIAAT